MQQSQPHSLEKRLQAAQNLTHALHKGHICIQILVWWLKGPLHNQEQSECAVGWHPTCFFLSSVMMSPPHPCTNGPRMLGCLPPQGGGLPVDKPSPSPADLPSTLPVVRTPVALWPWWEIPMVQRELGQGSSTRRKSRVSLGVPSLPVNSPWPLNTAWVTWMKVVLLLFCPLQPLKSAPHQEGRWLCQARLAPALEPAPWAGTFL